ncbi:putative nucelotide kinase [Pseudomonas phage EM]|uniref:Nucelotide kinase n=1 Tax=Pseudomonas phage EM TaxID=2936914 RepID=A0AAE9HKD1_9CAUD|nr:putative nucelotide kinase [Pseudomonas phage EM]UPW35936.1 putative nucelotide kinase [Pseudomonas phage EM]
MNKPLSVSDVFARRVIDDAIQFPEFRLARREGVVGRHMQEVLDSDSALLLPHDVVYNYGGQLVTRASGYIVLSKEGQGFTDGTGSVAMVSLAELVKRGALAQTKPVVCSPQELDYYYLSPIDVDEVAPEITRAWVADLLAGEQGSVSEVNGTEGVYDVEALKAMSMDTTPGASGRSSNYYMVEVKTVTTKFNRSYFAECNDLIRALKMSFAQGNIFKAIWRFCASENLGKAKANNEAIRDLEKIIFFAEQEIARLKEEQREA